MVKTGRGSKMTKPKNIIWTTKSLLHQAIEEAYLDYYGLTIDDKCVNRIIKWYEELLKEGTK